MSSVTVYDELASSLGLAPYVATYGTNGTDPQSAESCREVRGKAPGRWP